MRDDMARVLMAYYGFSEQDAAEILSELDTKSLQSLQALAGHRGGTGGEDTTAHDLSG